MKRLVKISLVVVVLSAFGSVVYGQPWDGGGVEGDPYLIYTPADMGAYEALLSLEPVIWVSATEVKFSCIEDGPNPADQIITIRNSGSGTLNWSIDLTGKPNWLSVVPTSGSLDPSESQDVTLSVDIMGLVDDSYSYVYEVVDPAAINSPQSVHIQLEVWDLALGDIFVPIDYPTIRAAINASSNGDIVVVLPGTYVENINLGGKAITLRSTDPLDDSIVLATIIDGDASGSVIICDSDEGHNTVIEGFLIRDGMGTLGAHNWLWGGGMYNYNSSPTVSNCTFNDNGLNVIGGGMGNYNSSPTVTNCTFSGNAAGGGGGGMANYNSSPTVTNCTFSDNGSDYGGGILNRNNSSPTVTNCTFSGNGWVMGPGAGMANDYSSPTVINCTFSGNTGSGMYNDNSSPTVINCTFSGNTGSGMYNYNSLPTVTNCILWDNSTPTGPEMYNYSSTPTVTYSDIAGGYTGEGNINADPLFADVDLRLSADSPCIDAGDNSAVPVGVTTDLDGNPRFVDDPDTTDTGNGTPPIVDMGAYEAIIAAVQVAIDIKPGSDDNTIPLNSQSLIPVAILSDEGFDALEVNADTVALAGADAEVRMQGKGIELLAKECDVDGDGDIDLVVYVATANFDVGTVQEGEAILTGKTYDGQAIVGWDYVTIVPK